MSYPDKMRTDGLCDPASFEIPARQLMGTLCVAGGADCPLFRDRADALKILESVKADPTVSLRLTSDADCIPHFTELGESDIRRLDREGLFNRKRDLDVLQRLGLAPGDTRRARYLYERLFRVIPTPVGICSYSTPGWEGCPFARSGIYERVHAQGSRTLVFDRSPGSKISDRNASCRRLLTDPVLYIRPHHLMCMLCWLETTGGEGARTDDTLDILWRRIQSEPTVMITLVEGNCEACFCCDGFHPATQRCVHACGLIRDYKKDLDLFQRLGMLPGDCRSAVDLLMHLLDTITSPIEICGYGNGAVTGESWSICGAVNTTAGYKKAQAMIESVGRQECLLHLSCATGRAS